MKKHINLIKFYTFAAVIMSVFASCGESDIFAPPVMYKTRAIGTMDQRPEQLVVLPGSSTSDGEELTSGVTATISLDWSGSPSATNVSASCDITIADQSKHTEKQNNLVNSGVHNGKAYAKFYVEVTENEKTKSGRDTTFTVYEGYVEHEAKVEETYISLDSNSSFSTVNLSQRSNSIQKP